MEVPLTLKKTPAGRISYGIPMWYRFATGAMLAFVVGGIFSTDSGPGLVGWLVIALLALGILYEERWIADPATKTCTHTSGLLILARTDTIRFDEIAEFRLGAFARGTIPGSKDEMQEKSRAFSMLRGREDSALHEGESRPSLFRMNRKKPYIHLILSTNSGDDYLVDTLPARSAQRLVKTGRAMAEICAAPFSEIEKLVSNE
jgi:hypothetical protein